MSIFEKMERVREIHEDLNEIVKTIDVLKYLRETVNAETAHRCFVIMDNLLDRADSLINEFYKLESEIKTELQGYYNSGS